jgi:hypothetical protein
MYEWKTIVAMVNNSWAVVESGIVPFRNTRTFNIQCWSEARECTSVFS